MSGGIIGFVSLLGELFTNPEHITIRIITISAIIIITTISIVGYYQKK